MSGILSFFPPLLFILTVLGIVFLLRDVPLEKGIQHPASVT